MSDERVGGSRALVVDDHPIVTESLAAALISLRVFEGIDKESSLAAASCSLARTGRGYPPFTFTTVPERSCILPSMAKPAAGISS